MKNSILIAFILFITLSVKVQAQQLKTVQYFDGNTTLNGLATTNIDEKLPSVLILPAWKGIDDEAKNAAIELQKEGYKVFIADIYGVGNVPKDNAAATKIAGKYKSDYKAYQKRIQRALEALKAQGKGSDKVAVIGYCFGGTGALEVARAGFAVEGVVSIHGGLGKDLSRANQEINTKVLIENPAEDKGVTSQILAETKEELNDGNADWQIITYANCGHTFTNPASSEYNEIMAKRAWKHTLLFLEEVLN